ncbi:MAG: sulfatase-like hydrolase/transferase [Phycisphaeraceae bacterium]|nr:sulfatase-like hydrolase/transferase [Phycisphaeraceae bacterium]
MKRNLFTQFAVFLLLLTPSLVLAQQPPNIVLIYVDDLGYGDLGCYGATKVQTPNIDSIAKQGRRFTDAHSSSAVCTPSRYGLLTGEYPFRAHGGKGVWGPSPITSGLIIDTNTLTIGKALQRKGYATACLGKWHLGFKKGKNDWQVPLRPGPQDVGFDYYFGVPVVNSAPPYVYVENDSYLGYDPADPLVYKGRGAKNVSPTPTFPPEASTKSPNAFSGALEAHKLYHDEKTGGLLAEKAAKWIAKNKDESFFLFFSAPNIHHPFTPAPRFKGTSQCGLYGDFIHELDWMVGEILKSLEDNGLSENTLVIFTSDNGGMLNRAGRDAMKAGHRMNGDLLGFKFGIWEGGHRVPFIARWPGKIKAGTESDQLISQVDMLATFAALTGQDDGALNGKDSINILPALLGETDEPLRTELVISARSEKHLGLRMGKWMYIGAQGSGGFTGSKPNQHAWGGPGAVAFAGSVNSDIQNGRIKKDAPPAQLYDLENDPFQTKNVYREHPDVVKQMQGLLKRYRESAREPQDAVGDQRELKRPKEDATAKSSRAKANRPPNFVVIFTDDQGYATAASGKWHLGDQPEFHPFHLNNKRYSFPPLPRTLRSWRC